MNNTTQLSNVLLTLLGIEPAVDVISRIDISLIQSIFEGFGVLRKIIIFSKEIVVKAFVEFESVEQAVEAKHFLHNCEFNDLGKIKIYFSALQKLDINSKFMEFKDFAKDRPRNHGGIINKFKKEAAGNRANQKSSALVSLLPTLAPRKRSGLALNKNLLNTNDAEKSSNAVKVKAEDALSENAATEPQTATPFRKDSEPTEYGESKVVLISNLNEFFFTVTELFNVFSCFGNLVKVLLMKNLKKALVEFKKVQSAQAAIACMNYQMFGKTKIKVSMSKYKKIDLKRNNKSEASQNFNEVIIVSNKMNRFQNSSTNAIAPTASLIAVIEKNEKISLLDVLLAIQPFGKPLRTKCVEEDKENQSVSLHQVVLKFQSVTQAIKVLAQAHNLEVNGYHLSLTFTDMVI